MACDGGDGGIFLSGSWLLRGGVSFWVTVHNPIPSVIASGVPLNRGTPLAMTLGIGRDCFVGSLLLRNTLCKSFIFIGEAFSSFDVYEHVSVFFGSFDKGFH